MSFWYDLEYMTNMIGNGMQYLFLLDCLKNSAGTLPIHLLQCEHILGIKIIIIIV